MHTVKYIHHTSDGDSLIAYMARVSNPSNQSNTKTSNKLIKYLIDHNHWSPFEMVSLCVEIYTTRSIAAQILRHRSFSFQEFSQRYAKVSEFPTTPNLRRRNTTNRQSSIDDLPLDTKARCTKSITDSFNYSYNVYETLLANGVAPECARDVLPLATPTKLYMHGTLRSWIHYTKLRSTPDTQSEHRSIAQQCSELIDEYFPLVSSALTCEGPSHL